MLFIEGEYSTPRYTLKGGYQLLTDTAAFYVRYTSAENVVLDIFLEGEDRSGIELPGGGSSYHYQVPLTEGSVVEGFRIRSSSGEENPGFKLSGTGIEEVCRGFKLVNTDSSSEIIIKEGFLIENPDVYKFKNLSSDIDISNSQVQLEVDYEYYGDSRKEYKLVVFSEDHEKKFWLNARRGGSRIYLYSESLGFIPSGLRFESMDTDLRITGISINSISKEIPPNYEPIPADIGTILNYKQSSWRESDFEIFSWNLFPDILILDFKDYALQSSSLKRISFFVEKAGFAGTLVDNRILSNLHGWNAHDYRAEGLAEFFTAAEESFFVLNPEEKIIRDLLVSNKIIKKGDSGYVPLSGGILSYSQESSPRLRRLFITHEGYHGVFFSDLEFASDVEKIWNNLDPEEQQFWFDFLDWKKYEIKDPYLVVNEFMAYLMQQNISQVESYYKDYIIPKYLVAFPEKKEEMDTFLADYPDHFLKNAMAIENSVYSHDSITAGELRCLY